MPRSAIGAMLVAARTNPGKQIASRLNPASHNMMDRIHEDFRSQLR